MNKKLLIIISTVVVVLGVFFVIYKKATSFKYELTTSATCSVDKKKGAIIDCECDVIVNNQQFKANNSINVESCDNHQEICKDLCETHVKDLDK